MTNVFFRLESNLRTPPVCHGRLVADSEYYCRFADSEYRFVDSEHYYLNKAIAEYVK
jgi:hypothetical protein